MSTPAIDVADVSKRYRLYQERNESLKATVMRGRRSRYEEFWALRDVSLEIPAGVTFGLIGENGSGKSTLLKCMARILRPDKGTIATRGKISALLELGAGFHPELSGRDNIFLNGSILGLGRRELKGRFDEIVSFAGLEQFIDAPVKNYSSGMYVRLGFSIAINVDPDILLIDEILAVGDAEFQRRCTDKFAELRSEGRTVVIVTHALGTVRELCDEAALLEHGVLQRVGPASEVVDRYLADVFTADAKPADDAGQPADELAHVERIEMLDVAGGRIEQVRTGEPVTMRLHFAAPVAVERPAFSLSVHSLDGVELTRPNTSDAGLQFDRVEGRGHVDLRVERLLLLPGVYDLTATIGSGTVLVGPRDRERALRITVEPGEPREEHGLVSLGGVWDFSSNGMNR